MNNNTIQVRAGESLLLSVDMEAYPKPRTFSWSFMGHELRNTSDHVITTHSNEYRCDSSHLCLKFLQSFCMDEMFITHVRWNSTRLPSTSRHSFRRNSAVALKLSNGFLWNRNSQNINCICQKRNSETSAALPLFSFFFFLGISCSIIWGCTFVANHASLHCTMFVFHLWRTGHDL